jgi:hypothetical protein
MKYLFIDIRKSDEVYAKHFDNSQEYSFYNIPMYMIRFNVQSIINNLEQFDEIYIVCQTATRSQFIKNKYFENNDKIKVSQNLQFSNLNHGSNNVSLGENGPQVTIQVVGSNSFNFYNIMRITQTILGTIMLSVGIYIYTKLNKTNNMNMIPLIILIAFGTMAIFNGLTSTCSMSILLQDYLN